MQVVVQVVVLVVVPPQTHSNRARAGHTAYSTRHPSCGVVVVLVAPPGAARAGTICSRIAHPITTDCPAAHWSGWPHDYWQQEATGCWRCRCWVVGALLPITLTLLYTDTTTTTPPPSEHHHHHPTPPPAPPPAPPAKLQQRVSCSWQMNTMDYSFM